MAWPAIPGAALAASSGHHLVKGRQIDHPGDRLAAHLHANQHAIERHAAHKGLGPIKRIDDPFNDDGSIGQFYIAIDY